MGNTVATSFMILEQAERDRKERREREQQISFINDEDLPDWLKEVHGNYHFDLKKSNTPDFAADLTFVLEHGRLPSHLPPIRAAATLKSGQSLSRSILDSIGSEALSGGGKDSPSARWWVSSNKGGLYTKSKSRRKYKRKKTKRKRRRRTSRK